MNPLMTLNKKEALLTSALAFLMLAHAVRADVMPNPMFSDNAVLQRDQRVPVWGKAVDGEKVEVEFAGQKVETVAKNGRWVVWLEPMPASTEGRTMTIRGNNTVSAKNLLVGEVWLCSGQSNMGMQLKHVANGREAIASSADPMIRLVTVTQCHADTPKEDIVIDWKPCSPATVPDFSAVAYFFGQELRKVLNVPIGLINSTYGGTAAKAWMDRQTLTTDPNFQALLDSQAKREAEFDPAKLEETNKNFKAEYEAAVSKALAEGKPKPRGPRVDVPPKEDKCRPACLYNPMIAPLQPYAIRGVTWYQGESDADAPVLYRKLFPALIQSWRKQWVQEKMPFLFVQIAPCRRMPPSIREAQLLAWKSTQETAMVVTSDVGDANDIHPKNKEPVGKRLALAARALAYGEKLEYSGPEFDSMSVRENRAVIHFKHIGSGIVATDDLKGFFVAGDNGTFCPAKAEISGDTVEVFSDQVSKPIAVRYGWANVPEINLFNKEGLPASPFRTDVSDSFAFPCSNLMAGAEQKRQMRPVALSPLRMADASAPVCLEVTPVRPAKSVIRGEVLFADFGRDVYGNLEVEFSVDPPASNVTVRLGEKLTEQGAIDRTPPGSVNYRELHFSTQPGQRMYRLIIPPKAFHKGTESVKMPESIGEVTPFRYVEIEGDGISLPNISLRQLFAHAPFKDDTSSFECSNETLNAVWNLCKHTMKATTAFGVYIDGERERIPYEADAYINLLSHYACDLDSRVARATFAHLLSHPTWPTEWSLHMPMIAAADYEATGDARLAKEFYNQLKKKLLLDKARQDGLLDASAIVDWPEGERDGYNEGNAARDNPKQAGPMINTVANAFYYRALTRMAILAQALGMGADSQEFKEKAKQVYASFNRVFWDPAQKLYVDGEGSHHASLHANMFAVAFDLTPREHLSKVADFLQKRGMACSVYGAQYLLEALFAVGKDQYAVELMAARTKRSWWHMIDSGSTMTWEAWDAEFKKNLTWNHAWGAAPANILSRFVLGVRPLAPGYTKLLIAPQPGGLAWARGKVPTPAGPITLKIENAETFRLEVEIPPQTDTTAILPSRKEHQILLDGKRISVVENQGLLSVKVPSGHHSLESR